jgi:hypothetical protein
MCTLICRHCGAYRELLVRFSSQFYDNHFDMLTPELAILQGKQAKLFSCKILTIFALDLSRT